MLQPGAPGAAGALQLIVVFYDGISNKTTDPKCVCSQLDLIWDIWGWKMGNWGPIAVFILVGKIIVNMFKLLDLGLSSIFRYFQYSLSHWHGGMDHFQYLWYTNIAIENGIYIVGLRHPVKMVTYHKVKLVTSKVKLVTFKVSRRPPLPWWSWPLPVVLACTEQHCCSTVASSTTNGVAQNTVVHSSQSCSSQLANTKRK